MVVGKYILENLTTGMYIDSKVMYREYIQNACDQIRQDIENGLLAPDEGTVEIFIDSPNRLVSIKDNAAGVPAKEFTEALGDIANSKKTLGKSAGFRGIGRLCGLAYCKTLRFITSFAGEERCSVMTCDAQKMRAMLLEKEEYTLDEIWNAVVCFSTRPEQAQKHYFEVELLDINPENRDLLDVNKVRSYISFVAPVAYKNTFIFRNQIYAHAKQIGSPIREYRVLVNGSQIFKEYTTKLKELNGTSLRNYDEISKLEFQDFYSGNGQLLAWMWVGLSRFEKQIPKASQMRGLRIRSENIQVGGDATLAHLFKEPRGNYYFVGEIFAVSDQLVPNSQRSYFNENPTRLALEDALRAYFSNVLHKLYYEANRAKSSYKRQLEYIALADEWQHKEQTNGFVNQEDRQRLQFEVQKAQKNAQIARKRLEKLHASAPASPIAEVVKSIGQKYGADNLQQQAQTTAVFAGASGAQTAFVADSMAALSKRERKLVGKILSIITSSAPKQIAEQIIEKIKEEMR